MAPMKRPLTKILLGFGAAVFLGITAAWGQTYSQARIVRLSFVEGHVTVQRPDVADWAEAPINTPLQEGFKLSTAEGSFAEVEFENGSTVRLGQLSMLEFTQLALASDGSKINRLTLDMGYATFHAAPESGDVYDVLMSDVTLTPRGKAMFRVDADSSEERVEVFHGSLDVASSLGSWTLAKNSVLDLSPGTEQPVQPSEGITQDDWDRWVQDREGQVEAASNGPSPGEYSNSNSNDFYGWSDLSYYGNWSYMPGFGYGWIPSVYAGWYPFSLGRWCWYPGFGYTWISGDPWGWLPYHYGGWEFIPGIGWVWFPGSFGVWSPGLVTWYGGSGWIGWVPRTGRTHLGNTNPCPQGQSCGTAVSTSVLRNGRPVGPGTILSVNPVSGRRIDQPDILPNRQAMLPGRIVSPPAQLTNSKLTIIGPRSATLSSQTANPRPTTLAPGSVAGSGRAPGGPAIGYAAGHAAPRPQSGIVYDPATGEYVNNSRLPSGPKPAPNQLSSRPLPSVPGDWASRAVQPASGTSQTGGSATAPQSYGQSSSYGFSSRSVSSSSSAPRGGGNTASGQTKANSSSSGSGSASGAVRSGGGYSGGGSTHTAPSGGGGGIGGGSHGAGMSSGGGHR